MNKIVVRFTYVLVIAFVIYSQDVCTALVGLLFYICFHRLLQSYSKKGVIELFDFKNYFLINYFYIHGVGYFTFLARQELGINWYNHDKVLLAHSLSISIIAILILLFTYNIVCSSKLSFKIEKNIALYDRLRRLRPNKWVELSLLIFLMFSFFWYMMGVIPFLTPGFPEEGRTEYGMGLGLIEAFCKSALNASLLFNIWVLITKNDFGKTTFLFFLFCASMFILNDERGSLVYYIISIAMIYYYCKRKFQIKHYLVGLLGIVILAGGIGALRRGEAGEGSGIARIGIEVATETAVEFDNYVESFNMFENQQYLYGSTYVPIFTIPIPRFIFPDKDKFLTAGNYFKEYHGHDHIRVGERLSYIGELYMNFGYVGIVLGMIFLGWFMAKIVKHYTKKQDLFAIYFYIQIVNSTVSLIAGDTATAVVNFIMSNIIVIIYSLYKRTKMRNNYDIH